jgi:hypothetical protein
MQKHNLLIFLFFILFNSGNISTFSQLDSTSNEGSSSISVGTGYSTNTNVFGSIDEFVSQPSYSSNAIFNEKHGFSLSLSPYFVGNSDSTNSHFTSECDFGAGYSWSGLKILSISTSYTHFFYSKNSMSLKSGFSDYASASTGVSVKWWNASISGGYGWGNTTDFSLNAGTGVTFKIKDLGEKDNDLTFSPSIGGTFNENQLTNLNTQKKTFGLADFVKLHPNLKASDFLTSTAPDIVAWRNAHPQIVKNIENKIKKSESKTGKRKTSSNLMLTDLLASTKTKFGFTSVNLLVPVSYNYNNFTFTTTLAIYKSNVSSEPIQYSLNFGVSYPFDL